MPRTVSTACRTTDSNTGVFVRVLCFHLCRLLSHLQQHHALHHSNSGKQGAAKVPAPYPGAWVEADGVQAVPQGFPFYLALAFVVTVIAPTAVLASCLLAHTPPAVTKALAAATLGPYLLVFVPQILLETRFLNRSFMTPVLPVLFAYYRFWQFIRSLGLIRSVAAAVAQQGRPSWLLHYLVSLMAFWAFDTACTIVWMPGMYEWQLQDVQLLTRLSQQRQHTVQQPTKAAASKQQVVPKCAEAVGGSSEQPAATLAAARVQHRWRLAGGHHRPADSGEFDYSFGY